MTRAHKGRRGKPPLPVGENPGAPSGVGRARQATVTSSVRKAPAQRREQVRGATIPDVTPGVTFPITFAKEA